MRRYISREIEDPLAEEIIRSYGKRLTGVHISIEGEKPKIQCL
jgi:ATP-dependent Clp protease ATP-binding subunit ClpA